MPRVQVNGIELCYESMGEGEPLLLIMGFGGQMIGWEDDFCRLLVARGFRVIRFDNRDVGQSSRLDHLGIPRMEMLMARGFLRVPVRVPYTLGDMTADTIGLLDALGIDSAHVVGASMGGMIGQLMAIEHPHRLRTLTSIMSHPSNWRSKMVRPEVMYAMSTALLRARKARAEHLPRHMMDSLQRVARLLHGPGFPFDEGFVRQHAARYYERGIHVGGLMRQLGAVAAAESRVQALRRVRVPTLVMHGTDDPLVPPVAAVHTARAIPHARLRWIRGMGHALPRGAWPQLIQAIAAHARGSGPARAGDEVARPVAWQRQRASSPFPAAMPGRHP